MGRDRRESDGVGDKLDVFSNMFRDGVAFSSKGGLVCINEAVFMVLGIKESF